MSRLLTPMGGGLRMGMAQSKRGTGGGGAPAPDAGKMEFNKATQSALIALLEDI